jgi:hypothetical protein
LYVVALKKNWSVVSKEEGENRAWWQAAVSASQEFTCIIIIFLAVLGLELRASHLLGRRSAACATPPAFFVLVFFEIGPHELFALAGFEP